MVKPSETMLSEDNVNSSALSKPGSVSTDVPSFRKYHVDHSEIIDFGTRFPIIVGNSYSEEVHTKIVSVIFGFSNQRMSVLKFVFREVHGALLRSVF